MAPFDQCPLPINEANAARLDYDLIHGSTINSQPAALSAAWLILFSLDVTQCSPALTASSLR